MLPRTLTRFYRATLSSHSFIPSVSRHAYHKIPTSIYEPPAHPGVSSSISLAHPRDPGSSTTSSQSSSSTTPPQAPQSPAPPPYTNSPPPPPPPTAQDPSTVEEVPADPSVNSIPPVPVVPTSFEHHNDPPEHDSTLPSPHAGPPASMYTHPPFDTHKFFAALERTFATPTARNLMRATRALLVHRIGRVREEALTVKDLESVSKPWSLVQLLANRRTSNCIFSEPHFLSFGPRLRCARGTSQRLCRPRALRYDARWMHWTVE